MPVGGAMGLWGGAFRCAEFKEEVILEAGREMPASPSALTSPPRHFSRALLEGRSGSWLRRQPQ